MLRHFATLGCAFEFASAGELQRVIAAGSNVKASVFAGVGKTENEIRVALKHEIYCFHVESEPELERINRVAGELGLKAPIAIRVNPDVDAQTHEKISTGRSEHKFGIPLHSAGEAYEAASKYPNLILKGIQMHIGSQITEVGPIKNAIQKVAPFATELKQKYGITHFSIGGGLGIVYPEALQSGEQAWWDSQP